MRLTVDTDDEGFTISGKGLYVRFFFDALTSLHHTGYGPKSSHEFTGSTDDLEEHIAQLFAAHRERTGVAHVHREAHRTQRVFPGLKTPAPAPVTDLRVEKVRRLAAEGATEGERAAARGAIARIEGSSA